jgi:signal transduction histidine kinase
MGPWYQTRWFWLLCAATVVLMLWAICQLRMRRMTRALDARVDERVAERTRIARDLQDSVLQTVQGSKMVADHALNRPDDSSGMRRALEQLSRWLGQASAEGRAAVNALRDSTIHSPDGTRLTTIVRGCVAFRRLATRLLDRIRARFRG